MITKFEVGDLNLDYSEFDIVELIQNVFDLLKWKKNITLVFENYHIFTHYVRADRDRIQQVIENLIVNSI
jgi:two-component system phosphate regulon sensor histidine kinase PhoR